MLNVIALMGRLVAAPELRKTTAGISTTTFAIACDRSFAGKDGVRQTDFLDIVCWRNTAEFVCKYMGKGQLIAVNGSLQTRSYDDKNGNKRKVYEVVADNVHFAEPKRDSGQAPRQASHVQQQDIAPSAGQGDFAVVEDTEDLPF